MSNVWQAWLSGRTVRKHTMDVMRRETTAEHTWGAMLLLEKYAPYAPARVLKFVLRHDSGEKRTCDLPAHLCWEYPAIKELVEELEHKHGLEVMTGPYPEHVHDHKLSAEELVLVEMVDRAEFVLSCLYELRMGNTLVRSPIDRALSKMGEAFKLLPTDSPYASGMQHLLADVQRENSQ